MKCKNKVFVKLLNKFKPCIRTKRHGNAVCCTPDLTGEVFGNLTVIKRGPQNISAKTGQSHTTWIVDQKGIERIVLAGHLLKGSISGRYDKADTIIHKKHIPEYATVTNHHYFIFGSKNPYHRHYKGMPFHDEWNPKQGGSFWKGMQWIFDNLGEKPGETWSIDIIDHEKGFVPGNLRWATKRQQARNRQSCRLGKFTLQELKVELKRHGYKAVKL